VNAIRIPEGGEDTGTRNLILRAGQEEVHYGNVALPPPLGLVDVQIEERGALQVSVTTDQSIDMAFLWVTRGDTLQWSSAGAPQSFRSTATTLEATVPQAVLDSCGSGCEAYLQVAHVWQDDSVFSLSEVKHKVL
jgi:hypothetical protein